MQKSLKAAAITFFVSLIILLSFFTFRFLSAWWTEIRTAGMGTMLRLVVYAAGTISGLAVPFSVLLASLVGYRIFFKTKSVNLNAVMKRAAIPALLITIFCFAWTAFAVPAFNLRMLVLLFNVRSPGYVVNEKDEQLFRSNTLTCNFFEINALVDTLRSDMSMREAGHIPCLEGGFDSAAICEALKSPEAASLGYKASDFKHFARKNPASDIEIKNVIASFEIFENERKMMQRQITHNKLQQAKMLITPVAASILFFFGIFLAGLSRKLHVAAVLSITVFLLLPAFYFLQSFLERLAKFADTGAIATAWLYPAILFVLTAILFFYCRRSMKIAESNPDEFPAA